MTMSIIEMDVQPVAIEVDEIIDDYKRDPVDGHVREDDLLKQIVYAAANGEDVEMICQEAVRLLETKRKRWYE